MGTPYSTYYDLEECGPLTVNTPWSSHEMVSLSCMSQNQQFWTSTMGSEKLLHKHHREVQTAASAKFGHPNQKSLMLASPQSLFMSLFPLDSPHLIPSATFLSPPKKVACRPSASTMAYPILLLTQSSSQDWLAFFLSKSNPPKESHPFLSTMGGSPTISVKLYFLYLILQNEFEFYIFTHKISKYIPTNIYYKNFAVINSVLSIILGAHGFVTASPSLEHPPPPYSIHPLYPWNAHPYYPLLHGQPLIPLHA